MEKIEILRILDTYSNEDEATKHRIANALLDLSNVVRRIEQLVCEHPDDKLWDIKGHIVCECGKHLDKKAN